MECGHATTRCRGRVPRQVSGRWRGWAAEPTAKDLVVARRQGMGRARLGMLPAGLAGGHALVDVYSALLPSRMARRRAASFL